MPSKITVAAATLAVGCILSYSVLAVQMAPGGGDIPTLPPTSVFADRMPDWNWDFIFSDQRQNRIDDRMPVLGGSGGGIVKNSGDTASGGKNANQGDPCGDKPGNSGTIAGNPVNFSTGNKIEPETDFVSNGEMGLFLTRTYNAYWDGIGIFGRYWLSSFDYKLLITTDVVSSTCYPKPGATSSCDPTNKPIWAQRPDGRKIKFNYTVGASQQWNEDKASPIAKIVRNADSTFTLYSEDHTIETYDASGFPLKIANEQNVGWSFTYNANHYLAKVTHNSGRAATLTWNGNQLVSIQDPAGNLYSYTYIANKFGTGAHLLTKTVQPGAANSASTGGTPATTLTYQYESSSFPGALTGVTINGVRYSWFNYDTSGRAIETKHADGADDFKFTYSAVGSNGSRTVTVTNPLGKQTVYTYDGNGNQISVEGKVSVNCPANYKESKYDGNGNPDLVSDFRDAITDYDYNAKGQVIQITENSGGTDPAIKRITQFIWDDHNRQVRKTVIGLYQVDTVYGGDGRVASVTTTNLSSNGQPNQTHTVTYAYTVGSSGLVAKVVVSGPSPGATITRNFSASGDLLTEVNALGRSLSYGSYNSLGQPGTVSDPNGSVIYYTYDPRGRTATIKQVVNAANQITKVAYNAKGGITDLWRPDGSHVATAYDAVYRPMMSSELVSSTADADVPDEQDTTTRQTLYSYNANSDITSITIRNAYTSWYLTQPCIGSLSVADASAAKTATAQPMAPPPCTPRQTSSLVTATKQFMDYDELGRPIAVRGNNGQNTKTTYDANSNVVGVADASGKWTWYGYDALNRVNHITDTAGGNTWIGSDFGDQVNSVLDPRGLRTQYGYDGFGLLWWQISPDTGTTLMKHDAYGRKTVMTRASGQTISYGYDGMDRIVTATAGGLTHTFIYDSCPLGKGKLCGFSDASGSTAYEYNLQGLVAKRTITTTQGSTSSTYAYDGMNRLLQTTDGSLATLTYTWTAGHISQINLKTANPNQNINVVSGASYDAAGQLTSFIYGNGARRIQAYDQDGRITNIQVASGAVALQGLTLSWNSSDRVTGIADAIFPAASQTYGYDNLGRVTSMSGPQALTLTYDANGNRTHQTWDWDQVLSVDAASNRLLSQGTHMYGYDANGNLASNAWGGSTATYGYDGFGRLTSVGRSSAISYCETSGACPVYPAGTTTYAVNALGQRMGKSGPLGTTQFSYDLDGHLTSEQSTATGSNYYIYLGNQPVALLHNGAPYYVHADHLGRPEIITNASRVRVWAAQNYAFDRFITQEGVPGVNIGLPGQVYDAETGHWHNGFRDYDASNGKYIESDPIGLGGGINTYAYAGGNPLTYVDPLGLAETNGTVLCDGNGGFKIVNNDHSVTRECTQQHEQSHVEDLKKWAPNICKGAPENYAPGSDLDQMSHQPYSSVPSYPLQRSECVAYRKSLACDSKCAGAQKSVDRDKRQLQFYKCDAWGW